MSKMGKEFFFIERLYAQAKMIDIPSLLFGAAATKGAEWTAYGYQVDH